MKKLFSSAVINRNGWERGDGALIEARLQQPGSRVLLWFDGQLVVHQSISAYFHWHELTACREILSPLVYLGQYREVDYFTCQLQQWDQRFDELTLLKLRQACRQFDDDQVSLLFHAQGMINWHRNHAFCPTCGHATRFEQAGHARVCENRQCAKAQYPKIDPAVIFSIVNDQQAESRILLARKAGWDEHRYSVVAGFVEPGETLEDSVKREAFEETGLIVDQVEYVASQPWPFPDALMLGFQCQTQQDEITLIDQELESARWFSADEIVADIESSVFKMPFEFSIAWHLIDRWFVGQKGYSLR